MYTSTDIHIYIHIHVCIHIHISISLSEIARRATETHTSAPVTQRCTLSYCNTLQHAATRCHTLLHTATHCYTLQHTATHCNTLQHTATHWYTLQHTATHCYTLQHVVHNPLSPIMSHPHSRNVCYLFIYQFFVNWFKVDFVSSCRLLNCSHGNFSKSDKKIMDFARNLRGTLASLHFHTPCVFVVMRHVSRLTA